MFGDDIETSGREFGDKQKMIHREPLNKQQQRVQATENKKRNKRVFALLSGGQNICTVTQTIEYVHN